jgi:hypothetical protein
VHDPFLKNKNKQMPTVYKLTRVPDPSLIAEPAEGVAPPGEILQWLSQFNDENDYYHTLNHWNTRCEQCKEAVKYSAVLVGIIGTVLTTIQSILAPAGYEHIATYLSYAQTGLSIMALLIGTICERIIYDLFHDEYDKATKIYTPAFFAAHAALIQWGTDYGSCCTQCCINNC